MPPRRWLVLSVPIPDLEEAAILPEALLDLGGSGVEEAQGRFTTFLSPPEDLDEFLLDARRRLRSLPGLQDLEIEWRWQPHEAWEDLWRRGLHPRKVTHRLWVSPTWEEPETEPGDVVIRVDPGMAFGTAEHASTRGCLRLLDSLIREGDRIADVGAGSGILSIAAARLGAREVLAFELDPVACEVAEDNVEANKVGGVVRVVQSAVHGTAPLLQAPFEGVLANLQRSILLPLLAVFYRSLGPGGWLVLSGVLLEEKEEIVGAVGAEGFLLDQEDLEGEWWSGAFRRTGESS